MGVDFRNRGEQVTMKDTQLSHCKETTQKNNRLEMGSVRVHAYIRGDMNRELHSIPNNNL